MTSVIAERRRPHRLAVSTATRFQKAVSESGLEFDDAQQSVIARLAEPPASGFYIWGSVGRGKSLLADLYYESVPTKRKRRFHFHDFFRDLQSEIFGTRRPIEETIRSMIGSARVVFFDEFHVHDVADAVYLTKTLEALLASKVLVIATSNYAPEDLMPNPMFHHRFEPAIALITSRFEIISFGEGVDYRRVGTAQSRTGFGTGEWWITPEALPTESRTALTVNGLTIRAVAAEPPAATFTFAELCGQPLGTNEYLKLAEDFSRIRIIAVPDLATAPLNELMRLCNVVDVFYHRGQRMDVESVAGPERMDDAENPPHDAYRILSRLATLQLRECINQ